MINTNLPLPLKKIRKITENGNQGLYFNKFFNQWKQDFSEVIKDHSMGAKDNKKTYYNGKMCWLLSQVHGPLPDNQQFEIKALAKNKGENAISAKKEAKRLNSLVKSVGGESRMFTTTSPFITGMGLSNPVENGFLWHHTLGVPYLSGSSIKGMIKAWARDWCAENAENAMNIERLFGREATHKDGAAAGSIIIFDALPIGNVNLYVEIMTPHDGGWRISSAPEENPPADWISPNPIPFLAVKEGAEFQFALAPRKGAKDEDIEKAYNYLEGALEWIGAGAKTAVGFGRFQSEQGRKNEEIKEKERSDKAPPKKGDAVEILYHKKKNQIGNKGIFQGINEFGEIVVSFSVGGATCLKSIDNIKKIKT